MSAQELGAKSSGLAFLVSAGIVYEIVAACCSSPQTAEINADKRAKTLMKWVNIGIAQSAIFIAIAIMFDPRNTKPILLGGVTAGTVMYVQYLHALAEGMKSNELGTEG